jgi:DNA invertase Pin-like site-specific DNA recombinase
MEKAFLYLRVSSPGQVEGYGFDRQEEACQAYAKKAGYEIVGTFQEEGVSGAKDETERPAFQEMMAAILVNGVRTVIVEGMYRLARELRIQEALLVYMAAKGVDLLSARTEENVTQAIQADPMKKALVQIQGVFAELDKNLTVKRLRKARDAKSAEQKKRCEGRKTFGCTPEEKKIVERIRAMRRTRKNGTPGMTMQAICDRLNFEGISTKLGKQWTPGQIHGILNRRKGK